MSAPLEELMQAALAVPEERREPAIKFLRGELEPHRPVFDPVLLNMGAAAKYLNISRPTLWRMIQAGRLRPVELFAGSRRIRRSDLDAIVQGNTPDKSEGGAR